MKKNRITKLLICFLATFSIIKNGRGMESEALEDLRGIVKHFFQPALYYVAEELEHATALQHYNKQNFSAAYEKLVPNSSFDKLPIELLVKICTEIDGPIPFVQGMGLTCQRFYLISTCPIFSLNPYCLTETMAHTIPLTILRTKVCNTKDGLLQVASLYSVSVDDLVEWFGTDMLEDVVKEQTLPESLQTMDELKLCNYAIFKIALAAKHRVEKILPLIQRSAGAHELSINQLRLCSLRQTKDHDYYHTLMWLFERLKTADRDNPPSDPDHSPIGVVARDLLLAGQYVSCVENHYVYNYPLKRERSVQLAQWQGKNTPRDDLDPILIHHASHLGLAELAFEIFHGIMLHNKDKALTMGNQNGLTGKQNAFSRLIGAFTCFLKDERVQPQLKEFARSLYPQHWGTLYPHDKTKAIILMLHAGQQDNALEALADLLLNTPEKIIPASNALLCALSERNCPQEVVQVIQCLLNATPTPESLSSILSNLGLLSEYRSNELLQSRIKEFAAKIYPQYWEGLNSYQKAEAIILMIHTGQGDHIPEAFTRFLSEGGEAVSFYVNELTHLLLENNYPSEATQLIQLFLNREATKVAPWIHNIKDFFSRAIEIDREKSFTLLKACAERKERENNNGVYTVLKALNFLALHDKTETNYVRKHLESLIKEKLINKDNHLIITSIYYHLNEVDLCRQHYQIAVEHLLEEFGEPHPEYNEMLNHLGQKGLHLKSLEELKDRDPIEVINIL